MATKKVSSATKAKKTVKTPVKKRAASKKKTTAKSTTKAARKASPVRLNIDGIKDVKDVKKILKALEKRLKTVEQESAGMVDKLVETLRLKEIYAKGNEMVSQAYKYTRDKCVGK